jgi:hypothetical protein
MLMPRMIRTKWLRCAVIGCAAIMVASGVARAQAPPRPQVLPQTVRRAAFRALSYDVTASLSPAEQTLSAKAIVEFEASEPSRNLECELHPNLHLSDVLDANGTPVPFERDDANYLLVRVTLPNPIGAGQRIKLTFVYSGPLANEEGSPVPGTRLASIANDGAYLLLPARWFPLTGYPANRYTGVFHIEVPQNFTVVGTGVAEAPKPVMSSTVAAPPPPAASQSTRGLPIRPLGNQNPQGPGGASTASSRMVYTFRADRPEAAGTFVAGALQLVPVKAEGLSISVYTPSSASSTAQPYGEAVATSVGIFSDMFGPLAQPNLTVAQIPDGTLASFAAPGLLLVSQREWLAMPNGRLLANLVASQWWGDQVMAASASDAWLTDGLARYSEALYVEQAASKAALGQALDDFAIGALMYEGAAPIAESGRLVPFSPEYQSVVVNKGATIFHMLRGQLGDSNFFALLKDFATQYSGKWASIDDFEKMAEARGSQIKVDVIASTSVDTSDDTSGPPVLKRVPAAAAAAPAPAPVIGNAPSAPSADSGTLNLRPFFAQWIRSTGVPEFSVDYTVFRTKNGFKIVGKVKQSLDFFRMPVELEVQTEGNPETKTIQISGKESDFDLEVFGRPKPNGIVLDPHDYILKSSERLRVRSVIARGEALAEQGRFYDAIQQYSQALDLQKNNSLADFRMGEAFFYQKNYSAAANAFRDSLDGDLDQSYRWVEVWSHIYLGKVYDVSGDRTRAVNEYSKAQQTNNDTGGAQAEAQRYTTQPYTEDAPRTAGAIGTESSASTASSGSSPSSSSSPASAPATPASDSTNDRPVLKRKTQ